MSTSQSDLSRGKKKPAARPRAARPPSASEIARNTRHFETWSSHQGCEQVSFFDLPNDIGADVSTVFNVRGVLPLAWINEDSVQYKRLSYCSPQGWFDFLKEAHAACPELFSDQEEASDPSTFHILYSELGGLYNVWRKLGSMRDSQAKYSEADYAAYVYNPIRTQAVSSSYGRLQCTLSLPQPIDRSNIDTEARRILNAKTVIPDFSMFVPNRGRITTLSHGAKSPYNILKGHARVKKCGDASKGSSFRFQATPCAQLPETPGFEFISSVFEDKKPTQPMLDDAYRQNRMATAAAARHLHSLHVRAPVFGLVWANGSVRAHVDWCHQEEGRRLAVFSAPYHNDVEETEQEDHSISVEMFHEWDLHQPSDILQVYFTVKNIDKWTTGSFRERVIDGVQSLVKAIDTEKKAYKPWKRVGEILVLAAKDTKENNVSTSISASSSSPQFKVRKTRRRQR